MEFGQTWDDDTLTTNLLGIHIANEIVPGLMTEHLRVKLKRGLQRLRINPTSLIGWVIAINNLVLSSIWFAIALWVGSDSKLKGHEKEITKFLRSKQGRRKHHRGEKFILQFLVKVDGRAWGSIHSVVASSTYRQVYFVGAIVGYSPTIGYLMSLFGNCLLNGGVQLTSVGLSFHATPYQRRAQTFGSTFTALGITSRRTLFPQHRQTNQSSVHPGVDPAYGASNPYKSQLQNANSTTPPQQRNRFILSCHEC